jgi:hypothetical protein
MMALSMPRLLTRPWIRAADRAIQTVGGMAEPPIPGRSGATTVNRFASFGISGRHIRDVSA